MFGLRLDIHQATIYIYFLMVVLALFTVFVVTRLKPMNAELSTFTEEQERLDAELANEQRQIDADIANQQRLLEAEREQQEIENERIRAELEAIREQVAVLGVDGYIALQQNEALKEAIASGDANVFVVPQGAPIEVQAP